MPIASTAAFFKDDFQRTLFPLRTNLFLIENGNIEIEAFIGECLDDTKPHQTFLSQKRVYAAKPNLYLRRTVKLDPVAEYFLYDIVYRNRNLFRKPFVKGRDHFGYRFEEGCPINASSSYRAFKGAISECSILYDYSLSFDVSSFFNCIYQHDLVSWMANIKADAADHQAFGRFLRQINTGRSVDCLPQGLYPAKMIGSDFLRFVDNNHGLKASRLVRFMDDFYLFSDSEMFLEDDFLLIQRLLGEKGLSLNPNKTVKNLNSLSQIDNQIDDVKARLLKRRRLLISSGYDENDNETYQEHVLPYQLDEEELDFIKDILAQEKLEEDDVELVLTVMRQQTGLIMPRLKSIIVDFPHLAKSIHGFCEHISDKEQVAEVISEVVQQARILLEFQLFWFGVILEDYLMSTSHVPKLIDLLYNHRNATHITKAKILENPDLRFGLPELRDEQLGAGQSDWLAWSSAVGHRGLSPASRNHRLDYFANASPINRLIHSIVTK